MIAIRNGCFETNSSSTHAMIVSTEKVNDYSLFDVEMNIGRFGWEFKLLDTPNEKASYFYTAACCYFEEDVFDQIQEMLKPYGIRCYTKNPPVFKLCEAFDNESFYYVYNGYVDHNDTRDFLYYLMDDPEHLISYLFSDKSYVVTGNDNCNDAEYTWFYNEINKADNYEHKYFWKGN